MVGGLDYSKYLVPSLPRRLLHGFTYPSTSNISSRSISGTAATSKAQVEREDIDLDLELSSGLG